MKKVSGILLYLLSGALALGGCFCLAVFGRFRWALWQAAYPALGEASSIGIIGGADGPTAIFVTAGGGFGPGSLLPLGGLLLAAGAGLFLLVRHLRKRRD